MKFDDIPKIEAKFKTDAASQLIPFSAPVAGENLTLNGLLYKPDRTGYYYETEYTKQRIVLHFTAGNIRSDILSLTRQDYHVSVAFVIARDGTIYQLHPSKYWSGHLGAGIGNQGTGNREDKASIAIEISNYAYLVPKNGNLETIYSRIKDPATGKTGPVDLYCTQQQTSAFTKLDTPFRDQSYYASYTKEQMESTIILLRFLTAKYQIPRQFLPKDKRFITTNDVVTFKGIVTHINYRPSGKWDIGPAFDWDQLITGVTAPTYKSSIARSRGVTPTKKIKGDEVDAIFEKTAVKASPVGKGMEEMEATDNEGYNPNSFDGVSLKGKLKSSSGQLYGLLVGINTYEQFENLEGCVADVKKMETYLEGRVDIKSNLLVLTNENASKKKLVSAFINHLGKAKEKDTVFFYYSGHGAFEDANALWDESDGTLECLVCNDKGTKKDSDYLLADKEQRYLINQLYKNTNAHIVMIFDCCHSGDNTRGALLMAGRKKKAKRKFIVTGRANGAFEERKWTDFIFSDKINKPAKKINIHQILPEAPHINFSACESHQVALESGGEGVFTSQLLRILHNSGNGISYADLGSQITQVMRFTEDQTPKMYAPLQFQNLESKAFLNAEVTSDVTTFAIYNEAKGWQINRGAIHNVQPGTKVALYPNGDKTKPVNAKIKEIYIDYAIIIPDKTIAKLKAHPVMLSDLLSRTLLLEMDNWHGHPQDIRELVDEIQRRAGSYYLIQGKEANSGKEADYALCIRNGDVIITRPDNIYRPIVRPMPLVKSNDVGPIVDVLIHIAKWHFIKELKNQTTENAFAEFPITANVTLKNGNAYAKAKVVNDVVQLSLANNNGDWGGTFRIELKNTSSKDLYVAALYLDKHFTSFPDLLPGKVHFLQKKSSVFLENMNSDELKLELEDQEVQYNWPAAREFIQIIASEEKFDITALALSELPGPYVLADRGKGVSKGIINLKQAKEKGIKILHWDAKPLQMELKNPMYNMANEDMLNAMLDYEEMTEFAAGIWYDVAYDEFGQPVNLILKEDIKLVARKKGLVSDAKIWFGNTVETFVRRRLYNKLRETDRIRIVAEGDSWFQYPIILKDVLDQLYKLYAIKSFAEAGDTLENYMKKKEYLKSINEEKATFFLVSGGGNDILGSQFKNFLKEKPTPGDTTPKRWLNNKFADTLIQLEKWYVEMITEVLAKNPNLYIITHSYDYVIPVDTNANPKTTSWLGKYMIDKGITNQSDREELIRYMVDEFNDRLKSAIAPFGTNVFYINVRGLIKRDGWHDEIHPLNGGFAAIADHFVNIIESVKDKLPKTKKAVPTVKKKARKVVKKGKPLTKRRAPHKKKMMMIKKRTSTKKSAPKKRIVRKAVARKAVRKAVVKKAVAKEAVVRKAVAKKVVHVRKMNGGPTHSKKVYAMPPDGATPSFQKEKKPLTLMRPVSGRMANGGPPEKRALQIEVKKAKKPTTLKKAKKPAVLKKMKSPLRPGQMDYTIPGEMTIGKTTTCIIRISGKEVSKAKIKISDESEFKTIEISDKMGVRLVDISGGDDFKITSPSTEKQAIEYGEFSEWRFFVTPLDSANGSYILSLTLTAYYNGKEKDIPILEKSIGVRNKNAKRVVFIGADTTSDLRLGTESKTIEAQLSNQNPDFQFTDFLDLSAVKLQDILLKEKPAILHYSGHSQIDGIFVFDENQKVVLAKAKDLETLFKNNIKEKGIECIILNSCYSQGQASSLQKFTKVMIGTTSAIPNQDAMLFSESFYKALFNKLKYKNAYESALAVLNINDNASNEIYNYYP